jgi:DNA-binding LytR/AlgR family response regulator
MTKIFVEDINYIEGWKDYVKLFMEDGKCLIVKQSISEMESLLSDHLFLRVHRSFLVSLDKISSYNSISIQLQSKEIPIGRLYKQSVVERLQGQ